MRFRFAEEHFITNLTNAYFMQEILIYLEESVIKNAKNAPNPEKADNFNRSIVTNVLMLILSALWMPIRT